MDRNDVRYLIGEKAEELAYWFCFLDSPRAQRISILENEQLKKDLLLINKANDEDIANTEMMSLEESYDL